MTGNPLIHAGEWFLLDDPKTNICKIFTDGLNMIDNSGLRNVFNVVKHVDTYVLDNLASIHFLGDMFNEKL